MADSYYPGQMPAEYNAAFFADELDRISNFLNNMEVEKIQLSILGAAPEKIEDGDVVYADGTAWNPGSGEGFYGRENGSWIKL